MIRSHTDNLKKSSNVSNSSLHWARFIHTLLFTHHHSHFSVTRTSCPFNSSVYFLFLILPAVAKNARPQAPICSVLCIRLCVISFYTVAYKSLSQGLHTDFHVALSDSLARIRPETEGKRQRGGEGDPDGEATSVLVWCRPDVDG